MQEVTFHFLFDASLRRAIWHEGKSEHVTWCIRQISVTLMQELMFYFLQQNRLRFMLLWYTKPIKLHMQNRHNKNCKHVLFLESYFFHLDILWEKTFSCTDKSIFIDSFLVQTYLTKQHTLLIQQQIKWSWA